MVGRGGGEMAQVTKKQPPPLNHQYNRRAQMKIMARHIILYTRPLAHPLKVQSEDSFTWILSPTTPWSNAIKKCHHGQR